MKGKYSTTRLHHLASRGWTIIPTSGPCDPAPVYYRPRTMYDPSPWSDGFFRYRSWELEPDTAHKARLSAVAQEVRHLLDPLDHAFALLACDDKEDA